jgi:hypothetical protein
VSETLFASIQQQQQHNSLLGLAVFLWAAIPSHGTPPPGKLGELEILAPIIVYPRFAG